MYREITYKSPTIKITIYSFGHDYTLELTINNKSKVILGISTPFIALRYIPLMFGYKIQLAMQMSPCGFKNGVYEINKLEEK